ncbi:MAG: hypothetical protein AAFZ18_13245, partial [Myxococcota bacterium]
MGYFNRQRRAYSTPALIIGALGLSGCSAQTLELSEATRTLIDASGGRARSARGELTIDVPEGALGSEVSIEITTLRDHERSDIQGPIYVLEPHGLTFEEPVLVRLSVSQAGASGWLLANVDGEDPVVVPGARWDSSSSTAIAELEHFSRYAVVAQGCGSLDGGVGDGGTGCGGDAGVHAPDGGFAAGDGGAGDPDGGPMSADGGGIFSDGGTSGSDGGSFLPDGGGVLPDGGGFSPDGGGFSPDGGYLPDGGGFLPDGGPYNPDGGPYLPDGGPYLPDGGPYLPDGGPYLPDGGPYNPDGGPYLPDGGPYLPDGGPYLPDGGP